MWDLQVPEGFYFIDKFNPASQYHLSLRINYPNESDFILGKRGRLGGEIFIHGGCESIGCIPITDEGIKELYLIALDARENGQEKIPVHIFPRILEGIIFNAKDKNELSHILFWNNLKTGYDYFEESGFLPEISVGELGKYSFHPAYPRTMVKKKYLSLLEDILKKQSKYQEEYTLSENKKKTVKEIKEYLEETITNKIFHFWNDTTWSFNGSTKMPKIGSIACGVLVSTVLEDAGFLLNRMDLSRQPAENIIKNLISEKHIKRFENEDFTSFLNEIKMYDDGLYIVGLDFHVGFMVIRNGNASIFHSSVVDGKVLEENAENSPLLEMSEYRVLGKLFEDDLIKKWLKQDRIELVFDSFNLTFKMSE